MESEMIQALRPVVKLLEVLGVEYFIGGSVASGVYGVARTTLDVDVVANLTAAHVAQLVQTLSNDYYVSENMAREAVAKQSCFNVIHLATSYKVDLFVSANNDYDRQAMSRRALVRIGSGDGLITLVASLEDMILSKLRWYRLGNEVSERQWNDVIQMMKIQKSRLDIVYLRQWSGDLNVNDLLDRALAETDR